VREEYVNASQGLKGRLVNLKNAQIAALGKETVTTEFAPVITDLMERTAPKKFVKIIAIEMESV